MKTAEKIVSRVSAALMFALMMLMVCDVFGRNILNQPLRGSTELTEIALLAITFLLFPTLAIHNGHIVADVADALHSRVLDVLKLVLTSILGGGLFGLIAWRMWLLADGSASYGEASPTLRIPLTPFLYGAGILAGICALCFLAKLRDLPEVVKKAPGPAEPQNTIL